MTATYDALNSNLPRDNTIDSQQARSEKEIILAIREFAVEDRAKSWFVTASTLLLLILLFVGSTWLPNVYARLICSLSSAFVFVRMFVIYHDFLHRAILQGSKLATAIFTLFGLFALIPVSIWERSHNHHHRYNSKLVNGDIGPYPIMTKAQYLASDRKTRFRYLIARHPATILLAYFTIFLYGMCLQPFFKSPARHYDCLISLLVHILFGAFLVSIGGVQAFVLTLFLPLNIAFVLGAYLFYAQHNFPGVVFLDKGQWSNEAAAMASSSYLVMGKSMSWVTGNIGYHHIHHLNCCIPFYRLPEVMERIPDLQKAKKTSLRRKDVVACLRLKLWDPAKNRMIALSEV